MRRLCLALLLLFPARALADDIGPPPGDCPRGSVGTSEHAGEWCEATMCQSNADCSLQGLRQQGIDHIDRSERHVCVGDVSLCVEREEYSAGGLWPGEPPTRTRRVARGPCVDEACPGGGTCLTFRRCVPGVPPPSAPEASDRPPMSAAPAEAPAEEPAEAPAEEEAAEEAAPEEEEDDGLCSVGRSGSPAPAVVLALVALAAWRRRS